MEKVIEGRAGTIDISEAAAVVRSGGVAVLPTDTIYGLHADAGNKRAIERVIKIKGKGDAPVFVLLASGMDMAGLVVSSWKHNSRGLLSSVWPAPLTALLPAADDLNRYARQQGKVALRVPDYPWLRNLIQMIGYPIISTSVNRSGERPLSGFREIRQSFDFLDLYVRGNEESRGEPSTIIDFTSKPPLLIRRGAFDPPFETIKEKDNP
ncbi:MAG: L-threonylcarbamoyladenylate synthase [Candidatus Krumholzibacteriales bacterium]